MQIVVMASGTRGDVQPMIALGKALQAQGHQVRLIAGSNFATWIESHGLETFSTFDMEALMQSELGVKWVESTNGLQQLRHMTRLLNQFDDQIVLDTLKGTQGADLLIGGFTGEPYTQAVSEKYRIPLISVGLQPYRATRSGEASLMPLLPRHSHIANRWIGLLAERFAWNVGAKTAGILRQQLDLPAHTARSYTQRARQIPALYAISPHVTPPVDDAHAYTCGYWFLDEDYTPPADLVRFIDGDQPPIYIGFGSMPSSDPTHTVEIAAEALRRLGRRGVLVTGWSGVQIMDVPEHLYLLDKAPHHWLFPKMAAVVHHGGAGTTAAGLRAGKPTLIIPHMADQPYWGRRVHELGIGTKPISRRKLTLDNLAQRLNMLLTDQTIQAKAAALGACIREEQGIENAVAWINRFLQ